MRVLIVDDQEVSREVVREMLEMWGHEVVGASADGVGALEAARSMSPDVVLVDSRLGDERGTDVVRLLRTAHPDLPVVLMSMSNAPTDLQGSGASGFVTKERLLSVDLSSLIG
jgi:two-component system response regulator EvgA